MSNGDYIRSRLSDRDMCILFINQRWAYEGFLWDVRKVYDYWKTFKFTDQGNIKHKGEKTPSIWNWRRTLNKETGEWETTGRTLEVAFSVWLANPYKKENWDEAIREYDKRHNIK